MYHSGSRVSLLTLSLWLPSDQLTCVRKFEEEKQKAEERKKGEWPTSDGKEKESVWLYLKTCEN